MDYYIGPNGELYHGLFGKGKGKPRDDHKYIKREWKNGRWQYTYKQDAKANKASSRGSIYINARDGGKGNAKLANALTAYKTQKEKARTYAKVAEKLIKENVNKSLGDTHYGAIVGQKHIAILKAKEAAKQVHKLVNKQSANQNETSKVSKEYQEEVAYNSQKNQYPNGDGAIKETVIPEKVIKETVIPESFITESNSSNASEKKESWTKKAKESLDNLGDWASVKLSDLGDGIKDFADDVGDWVDERLDDLHNVTIGKAKDSLGYDEREAMAKAYDKRDFELDSVRDMMYQIDESLHDEKSTSTRKIEMVKWISDGFIQPRVRRYLEADVEYQKAAEEYYSTPIGRLDRWINDRETAGIESSDAKAVQKRFSNDSLIREAEVDFVVSQLTLRSIEAYLTPPNSPWTREDDTKIYDYSKELESSSAELYRKLKRYAHNGTDLRRTDNSNIELDRVDRIVRELEAIFNYDIMGRLTG